MERVVEAQGQAGLTSARLRLRPAPSPLAGPISPASPLLTPPTSTSKSSDSPGYFICRLPSVVPCFDLSFKM